MIFTNNPENKLILIILSIIYNVRMIISKNQFDHLFVSKISHKSQKFSRGHLI